MRVPGNGMFAARKPTREVLFLSLAFAAGRPGSETKPGVRRVSLSLMIPESVLNQL